ncbi:MAG TPA: hypothetical protein DCQ31_08405, partial [Bacteroidales bacterium]|nr:hypothetical protein [Bacteroidales bacterium]
DGGSAIVERGICWSRKPLPTTLDEKILLGTGLGEFSCTLSNLSPGTTYFVRAFATNGIGTAYGNEIVFTTLPLPIPNYSGELVLVAGGSFELGCSALQMPCEANELPVHNVTLSDFYMGKYEVTNQEFANFLNAYGQATVKAGEITGENMLVENLTGGIIKTENGWEPAAGKANYPAIGITWFGANEFCAFYGGRLPTEAEWEFAAKGGIHATDGYIYSGSNQVEIVAIYAGNSTNASNNLENGMGTFTIGSLAANQLGVFDLSGNVNEWVSDWYADYTAKLKSYLSDTPIGTQKIYRGGSWKDAATGLKVTARYPALPNFNGNNLGFRFVKAVMVITK